MKARRQIPAPLAQPIDPETFRGWPTVPSELLLSFMAASNREDVRRSAGPLYRAGLEAADNLVRVFHCHGARMSRAASHRAADAGDYNAAAKLRIATRRRLALAEKIARGVAK